MGSSAPSPRMCLCEPGGIGVLCPSNMRIIHAEHTGKNTQHKGFHRLCAGPARCELRHSQPWCTSRCQLALAMGALAYEVPVHPVGPPNAVIYAGQATIGVGRDVGGRPDTIAAGSHHQRFSGSTCSLCWWRLSAMGSQSGLPPPIGLSWVI